MRLRLLLPVFAPLLGERERGKPWIVLDPDASEDILKFKK
jgi:hypothetical protein